MSSVGGAAWKTEEEIAAHIITEKKQVQDHPEDRLRRAETEGHPDRRLEEDRQVGEVLRTERAWKKTTEKPHDPACPVNNISNCSNSRDCYMETIQPVKRAI